MSEDLGVGQVNETPSQPRVLVLIATIPARAQSCNRLLAELKRQTRRPDGFVLVMDGYADGSPSFQSEIPIVLEKRFAQALGAGNRWRVAATLPPEDIVVNLDDDVFTLQAPKLIETLVKDAEQMQCAAAAMGRDTYMHPAPPGAFNHGDLLYGAGCSLTFRPKHLVGIDEFNESVKAAGGPDALGVLGDDDALVSAFLWKQGIKIWHSATGNIFPAPNTRQSSQSQAKLVKKEPMDAQKLQIAAITGWPWKDLRPKQALGRSGPIKPKTPGAGPIFMTSTPKPIRR